MAPDLAAVIDKFPATFGLRAFPGDTFRVSHYHSFISTRSGVQLYTERRQQDGTWRSFAKGTPDELWRELVHLEEERAPWQVGRTRWRHGVESSTPVLGVPADKVSNLEQALRSACEDIGDAHEYLDVSEVEIVKAHVDGTVDVVVSWYTGGDLLLCAGRGEPTLRRVLEEVK